MNKTLASIAICTLILSACKKPLKNVEDYYPSLTVSAEIQNDGTVKLKGQIISGGASEVENVGFSWDTKEPMITSFGQKALSTTSNNFSAVVEGITNYSDYQFIAWATNSYGFGKSIPVKISNLQFAPVSVPCSITPNSISCNLIGNDTFTAISSPQSSGGLYTVSCSTNSLLPIYFEFSSKPQVGIFTTKNTSAMNQKTVRITAYASSGTAVSVYDGAKVYIKSVANSNNLQVSICDATVTAGGSTQSSLKTQFIIPM